MLFLLPLEPAVYFSFTAVLKASIYDMPVITFPQKPETQKATHRHKIGCALKLTYLNYM